MATLTSASTDQQVWDAFDDNASFEEDDSPSKAAIFVTACRILLRRRPERVSTNGYSVDFDGSFIQAELERAIAWRETNQSSGESVRYLDFRGIRS